MISYLIIGSGYRAEYFGRIARTYSSLFRAMYLCRSEEKADKMKEKTGMSATVSIQEGMDFQPDFVVVAVDRGHVADVAVEWIERGYAVLTETPVGDTPEKLNRLCCMAREGARISCCEQYHRYPFLAAGLKALQDGIIGQVDSIYLSLLHDYHAASVIRRALGIKPGESYIMRGNRNHSAILETDSRYGAILDGRKALSDRDLVHIQFESGKEAVYDFSSVQYRTYIRSRHITVRGDRGEWSDSIILYADAQNRPQRLFLLPEIQEKYRILDNQALRDRRRFWSAEMAMDTNQDEFAIASMLLDMGEYLQGGVSPYPLGEAVEDAWFWINVMEAVKHPWQEIRWNGMTDI